MHELYFVFVFFWEGGVFRHFQRVFVLVFRLQDRIAELEGRLVDAEKERDCLQRQMAASLPQVRALTPTTNEIENPSKSCSHFDSSAFSRTRDAVACRHRVGTVVP